MKWYVILKLLFLRLLRYQLSLPGGVATVQQCCPGKKWFKLMLPRSKALVDVIHPIRRERDMPNIPEKDVRYIMYLDFVGGGAMTVSYTDSGVGISTNGVNPEAMAEMRQILLKELAEIENEVEGVA